MGMQKKGCKQTSAHMLKQKTIGPGCKSTDCPQTSCFAASLACPGRCSLRDCLQMLQETDIGSRARFSDFGTPQNALGPFWRIPSGSSSLPPCHSGGDIALLHPCFFVLLSPPLSPCPVILGKGEDRRSALWISGGKGMRPVHSRGHLGLGRLWGNLSDKVFGA